MKNEKSLILVERIENRIFLVREQKVILDADLAELYGVETRRLNEQVRRNIKRFPIDFMFQISKEEFNNLKSHFATSSLGWGGKRKLPFAFTEYGSIMAASVLNSPRAVDMSVFVVRAFIQMRKIMGEYVQLKRKIDNLENKYDSQFKTVFDAIRKLMSPIIVTKKRQIGFTTADEKEINKKL